MTYEVASHGGVAVRFEGTEEVEAVSAAFSANIARLESLGNDSSVSDYQRRVARWKGCDQTYRGAKLDGLLDPLQHYVDGVEDRATEAVESNKPRPDRIRAVAKHYRLGYHAELILEELQQHRNGEAVGSVD